MNSSLITLLLSVILLSGIFFINNNNNSYNHNILINANGQEEYYNEYNDYYFDDYDNRYNYLPQEQDSYEENYYNDNSYNTRDSQETKLFAIHHAQSGSISKVNETTNFLELNDVSNPILFSDRPDRIVKTESTQQFLDKWYSAGTNAENTFFLDPPNAALIIDDQQSQDVVVVELFEPAYDYDSNILVYNFNYLNNTISKLPSEFGQTTLVIDVTPDSETSL